MDLLRFPILRCPFALLEQQKHWTGKEAVLTSDALSGFLGSPWLKFGSPSTNPGGGSGSVDSFESVALRVELLTSHFLKFLQVTIRSCYFSASLV